MGPTIPSRVPVMILSNVTLFPGMMLPLFIFEPRYRRMLADVLEGNRMFAVAMLKPGGHQETAVPVGGVGLIRASVQNEDGTSNLILQGLDRVAIVRSVQYKPYRVVEIAPLPMQEECSVTADALMGRLKELLAARIEPGEHPNPPALDEKSVNRFMEKLQAVDSPEQLADMVSCSLIQSSFHRQEILETVSVEERLRKLIGFLMEIKA